MIALTGDQLVGLAAIVLVLLIAFLVVFVASMLWARMWRDRP